MNIRLRPTKQLMFVLENVAMTWVMFSLTLFMFLGCHFHFLWECSSQYFGVLLPFFMEVFIITFFLCSLKGISPMDRERNLFPAVSPVQPQNGRLAVCPPTLPFWHLTDVELCLFASPNFAFLASPFFGVVGLWILWISVARVWHLRVWYLLWQAAAVNRRGTLYGIGVNLFDYSQWTRCLDGRLALSGVNLFDYSQKTRCLDGRLTLSPFVDLTHSSSSPAQVEKQKLQFL